MWIDIPATPGRGTHRVLVPTGFDKSVDDFESIDAFLRAIRAQHKLNFDASRQAR